MLFLLSHDELSNYVVLPFPPISPPGKDSRPSIPNVPLHSFRSLFRRIFLCFTFADTLYWFYVKHNIHAPPFSTHPETTEQMPTDYPRRTMFVRSSSFVPVELTSCTKRTKKTRPPASIQKSSLCWDPLTWSRRESQLWNQPSLWSCDSYCLFIP